MDVQPDVIQSGRKILAMSVSCLKMRFLNYSSYLTGNLREIGELYRLPIEQHYFPESWNEDCNYGYSGEKPNLSEFFCFSDTKCDKEKKSHFHADLDSYWIMSDELVKSCRRETLILSRSSLFFLTLCFDLEDKLAKRTSKIPCAVHPFADNICSTSGFTFYMYCFYFMNEHDIFSVMSPYSAGNSQTSRGEFEWMAYLDWKYPEKKIVHLFNFPSGQKVLGRRHLDGYSETSKEIFQYKGCEVRSKFRAGKKLLVRKNQN
jgi:hypothetical protein